MKITHDCLGCGALFVGRPNKKYCSSECKNREKGKRRRLRHLEIAIEHADRQKTVAERRASHYSARFYSWRLRQLREELEALEKGAEIGALNGPLEP